METRSRDSCEWMWRANQARTYWDYFDPEYSWDSGLFEAALRSSQGDFLRAGFSPAESEELTESGYIVIEGSVIDRYYGGLRFSTDGATRIRLDDFARSFDNRRSRVSLFRAESMAELHRRIDFLRSRSSRRLLFRGQTSSYALSRGRPNPSFEVEHFGEVSLLPSLWRKLNRSKPNARQEFIGPFSSEWTKVVTACFGDSLSRRVEEAKARGDHFYTLSDYEDSTDPVISRWGTIALDLVSSGTDVVYTCQTLLQHYGLLSPTLDLTSNLDVALFFATHKYCPPEERAGVSQYRHVGSNQRRAVIYVLRESIDEMQPFRGHRVVDDLKPLRPIRQDCVVCSSGPDAMNLAADFLIEIILLAFDDPPVLTARTVDYFPDPQEDKFLAALKSQLHLPDHVTSF